MPKHIVRLIVLILAFVAVGVMAKGYFTADSFYRFGHYRADSVAQIAAKEPVYQTPRYCQMCHSARYSQWSASNHKTVICEVCHGAAEGHPQSGKLPIPSNTAKLCSLCHEAMTGRPRTQPQIDVAVHSGGQQCVTCHNPHSPKITTAAVAVHGNAAAGKERAAACASCHGDKGMSPNDTWPNLAGQNPGYLVRILMAYKTGAQKDVMMSPLAQALSDADIQNLATHFSALGCKTGTGGAQAGDVDAGKALAKNCAACHGDTGLTTNPAWPRIAGQKATYLVNALKAFRAGLRKDPMMGGVTRGLSDTDIANVAAYFAAQSCQSQVHARND
ncbi:MAG TPA: c-type cytochrome [Burkholderiales bacterium]|nr:c-type cytochrome [Burkholderiales bacterium]